MKPIPGLSEERIFVLDRANALFFSRRDTKNAENTEEERGEKGVYQEWGFI